MLHRLEDFHDQEWDLVIIGGGATGLGAALEAVTRGLKTLLVEQSDFAKATSSRSTKLVHGGVRYLAQGNISLVMEALRERGRLKRNAPHLVKDLSFLIPVYHFWGLPFYSTGLILYDLLAGRLSLGKSRPVSRRKALGMISTLIPEGLYGGVMYHDCFFDDSRLAINLMQTFVEAGGTAINYMKVTRLLKRDGRINGVMANDLEGLKEYKIRSGVVLNATGIFVDEIRHLDDAGVDELVKVSQGVHIVIDRKFLPGDKAILIPKTKDGRILFAIPWHHKVVVGTTDVPKLSAELEPVALKEEIDFILETAGRYLALPPGRSDIRSVFAGLRPLAAPKKEGKSTKEISRRHVIRFSDSGLVSITGGKWTTYRKMGEDVISRIIKKFNFEWKESVTEEYKIHGYTEKKEGMNHSDIMALIKKKCFRW